MDGPSPGIRRSAANPSGRADLDRRHFLILVGSAAAYSALNPALTWARRLDQPSRLQPWRLPAELPANTADAARALIGAAVLAPSDWNTQPWRFEVEENHIRIVADVRRALPVTDPDRRGLMAALGAALENLLVAARGYGVHPNVLYFPQGPASPVVADMTWTPGDLRRDRALFESLPLRRTNRREYDGRAIFPENRVQLVAQSSEDVQIHWLDGRDRVRAFAGLAHDATRQQMRDARAEAEQYSWMRFDGEEKRRGDGVPVSALAVGPLTELMASRYFNPRSMFLRFGVDAAGDQARDQVRTAGALALFTVSKRAEPQWVLGGQTYERFCLKATQLGIAHQTMSAPLENANIREHVLAAFGAGGSEPLALVRLGHAKPVDSVPRRAVALVSSFRNA